MSLAVELPSSPSVLYDLTGIVMFIVESLGGGEQLSRKALMALAIPEVEGEPTPNGSDDNWRVFRFPAAEYCKGRGSRSGEVAE